MKRTTMKLAGLTITMCLIASTSYANPDYNLENDEAYKKLRDEFSRLTWISNVPPGQLCLNDFIQAMATNIKKSVFEVINVVNDFITPGNPAETFSQYIAKCKELADTIKARVVDRLAVEMSLYDPASVNYRLLQQTHKIVAEFYTKFNGIYHVLNNHRNSKAPTNAVGLATVLRPQLLELTSQPNLSKLYNELVILRGLLEQGDMIVVANDITQLLDLLKKVQQNLAATQGTLNQTEVLTKIRRRLQRL